MIDIAKITIVRAVDAIYIGAWNSTSSNVGALRVAKVGDTCMVI